MIVNGVTLPDLPENWYAQNFIIVAITDSEQTLYKALMGVYDPRDFYYIPKELTGSPYSMVSPLAAEMAYAQCTVGATEWEIPGLAGGFVYEPVPVGEIDGVTTEVVWSNHDIYEVTSINAEAGEFTTGDIYFPNSEASHPERVSIGRSLMDKIANEVQRLTGISDQMNAETIRDWMKVLEVEKGIQIGDATAPPILADDLAQYPYVVLFKDYESGTEIFYLVFAKDFFFHVNPGVISGLSEEYIASNAEGGYRMTGVGGIIWGAWNDFDGSVALPVSSTLEVVWSNHDIHELTSVDLTTGDYTTGDLYFPPLEAIDSDRVSIGYDLFNSIVTDIQRLTGITEQMNALKAYWWLTKIVALS